MINIINTLSGKTLTEYKKNLNLNCLQQDLLIGTLLGDASMQKVGETSNSSVKWEQKYSQKEYLDHIYFIFKPFLRNGPQLRHIKGKNGLKDRKSYWLRTISHPIFSEYKRIFYKQTPEGKQYKIIPEKLYVLLTPRALAYWYMDDGYYNKSGFQISTNSFTFEEHLFLQKVFKSKYNIDLTLRKLKHKYKNVIHESYYIYIPVKSKLIFLNLVKPYILPSFLYKID